MSVTPRLVRLEVWLICMLLKDIGGRAMGCFFRVNTMKFVLAGLNVTLHLIDQR